MNWHYIGMTTDHAGAFDVAFRPAPTPAVRDPSEEKRRAANMIHHQLQRTRSAKATVWKQGGPALMRALLDAEEAFWEDTELLTAAALLTANGSSAEDAITQAGAGRLGQASLMWTRCERGHLGARSILICHDMSATDYVNFEARHYSLLIGTEAGLSSHLSQIAASYGQFYIHVENGSDLERETRNCHITGRLRIDASRQRLTLHTGGAHD